MLLRVLLLLAGCAAHGTIDPVPPADTDETDTVPVDTDTDAPPPPDTDVPPPDPSTLPPELSVTTPPGLFVASATVELVCSDPGAEIWYTLDGSLPAIGTGRRANGPIEFTRNGILRAVAHNDHGDDAFAGAYVRMDPALVGFSSDLPIVVLWTGLTAPTEKSEFFTPFTLSTFEPTAGGRVALPTTATLSTPAGLKVRGSSSAWYPKHPYRLETWKPDADDDDNVELLGMPSGSDWVLGAPLDFDRALMRDPLIFALSNLIGRYAPRTRFVELFVVDGNAPLRADHYVGVYVATEHIERDADRVAITKLLPTDVADPEVTGGYLFKEDRLGPGEYGFTAGVGDGRLRFEQPFVMVDPEESELMPEQQAYLTAALDELGVALTSPGFTHPVTGHHYRDLIDVDAWIDHHILNTLAKNPDAFRLSGFLHKDRLGPIVAGPVWDFDRTMGCANDDRAINPTWWDATNQTPDTTDYFGHGFWAGLFADPAFRDAWTARWRDLLNNQLTTAAVAAVVDGMAAELDEAADRNFAAWPDYGPRGGSYASEVELLQNWLADRHSWIDGCLDLPDPRTCRGR